MFTLRAKPALSSDGTTVQVLDDYGNYARVNFEDAKAGKALPPNYKIDQIHYRIACEGEVDLTVFLKKFLGIPNSLDYTNGAWTVKKDAAENAKFGQTGPKVGSFDAGFGSSYLARIVGQKKAREIWFMCRLYTAKEAENMGMVNKVVPYDQLEEECISWAKTMMERSPMALRMIKAGLNAELDGQAGIQQLAGDATLLYYFMDEAQEGGRAFLEKRKPNWGKPLP